MRARTHARAWLGYLGYDGAGLCEACERIKKLDVRPYRPSTDCAHARTDARNRAAAAAAETAPVVLSRTYIGMRLGMRVVVRLYETLKRWY